jgi:dienelactone hydrolase
LLSIYLALVFAFGGRVNAQVVQMQVYPLKSITLTDREFLTGAQQGKPAVIAGELRMPSIGPQRLPVVVLIHGSGGVSGFVHDWSELLNALGIATLIIDSFTGRGIVTTVNDRAQLGRLAMIIDAYRALEVLSKHPRIDPQRIAVVGFSRGGQAALYSSLKRFQEMHGPTNGSEFAAYITFYPACNVAYLNDIDVSDKPIRIFHGSVDNFNLIGHADHM